MQLTDDKVRDFSYARVDFKLENGLSVIYLPVLNTQVLALQMWVKTGSIHEGSFLGSGVSHFVEHMVFKGTQHRTYVDIFKETQQQGAKMNAYTSFDRTVYTYDGHVDSFAVGLDILGDMLCNSVFPEEELVKERDVILREIAMCNDDPEDRLSQLLFETTFQRHPYHYPIIGIQPIFEQLTREDLLHYYKSRYMINNMTLIVAGNIELETVKDQVQRVLGHYVPRSIAPIFIPKEPFQLAQRNKKEYGDYQITRGAMAFKIPGIGHKDSAKLQVLATLLGGGESSVLYQKLREQKQLVYTIDASSWMADGLGLFWIQYTCDKDKKEEVIDLLNKHLSSWAVEGLNQEGIEKTYRQTLITELDAQKTVSGRAHHVGWASICLGDADYFQQYLQQLKKLTVKEVSEIIPKYFKNISCSSVTLEPLSAQVNENVADKKAQNLISIEEEVCSGVRLIYQKTDFPKTNIQVLFRAGALLEPTGRRGLSQLLATLLTKDTKAQSALDIAKSIEQIGGRFNGLAGNNYLGLMLEVLNQDVSHATQLLKNALVQPSFLKETFENEKKAQIADLQEMQDDVFYAGFQAIRKQFFKDNPYNIGHMGTEQTVCAILHRDVLDFYEKIIHKGNCVVSVASSLSKTEVIQALSPLFQALPKVGISCNLQEVPWESKSEKVEKIFRKEQAMIFRAYPMAGITHEDFYIGEFLEELFNGLSSRFVDEVREKRGLAYTVGATRLIGYKQGMFCLFAGTRREQISSVEKEMDKAIQRILNDEVSLEEFETCRTCLKVNRQLNTQTLNRRAFGVGYNCLLGLPIQHWQNYESYIEKLSLKDFFLRCQSYLQPFHANTLILTPSNHE